MSSSSIINSSIVNKSKILDLNISKQLNDKLVLEYDPVKNKETILYSKVFDSYVEILFSIETINNDYIITFDNKRFKNGISIYNTFIVSKDKKSKCQYFDVRYYTEEYNIYNKDNFNLELIHDESYTTTIQSSTGIFKKYNEVLLEENINNNGIYKLTFY